MAYTVDYDGLDYGDETRGEAIQTVGLPHDESSDGLPEGKVVAFDGDKIIAASAGDEVGVLYTYKYYGDSRPPSVRQDRNATVAVGGKFKVEVASDVSAGDKLEADGSGVLDNTSADSHTGFVALTDAQQQDNTNPNGAGGEHYAEVLMK